PDTGARSHWQNRGWCKSWSFFPRDSPCNPFPPPVPGRHTPGGLLGLPTFLPVFPTFPPPLPAGTVLLRQLPLWPLEQLSPPLQDAPPPPGLLPAHREVRPYRFGG